MSKLKLRIDQDGSLTGIHHDELADLYEQGSVSITRQSNVEPSIGGLWLAYMRDGATLGPYRTRAEALRAEVDYLSRELFQCAE